MSHTRYLGVFLVFLGMTSSVRAQSDPGVSLGDLARTLRQDKALKEVKEAAAPSVADPKIIDNDNLTQVIDEVETLRMKGKPVLSFESGGAKQFQMSSPDGTCSLSFNANTTALISSAFVSEALPASELTKLDGPANIRGDMLEVAVYNATSWDLREITVGLTIVRHSDANTAYYGAPKLLPAVVQDPDPADKHPDSTVLLHLKASGAPFATTVFREKVEANLDPDQEWHWAIVEAKGIPPKLALNNPKE